MHNSACYVLYKYIFCITILDIYKSKQEEVNVRPLLSICPLKQSPYFNISQLSDKARVLFNKTVPKAKWKPGIWLIKNTFLSRLFPLCWSSELMPLFLIIQHTTLLTSWLLLLGLLSDSLTRDDLMSARSPSSSEWLSSAKICSLCGSPSSLNAIISSVAHSSGSPLPPDNCGILYLFLTLFHQENWKHSTVQNYGGENSH